MFAIPVQAADFHTVGWTNTFLPGGGALLQESFGAAAFQAGAEVSAFGLGYSWSMHERFDLDGAKTDPNRGRANLSQFLQEVGIKYHMVNVFNSYRSEYAISGGDAAQGIDQRSTLDLFKDPFDPKVLESPLVWIPLIITAGAIAIDYQSQLSEQSPIQKQNFGSNFFSGANQLGTYPIGSGAPEEMFYRGFLQNEFYHWVNSPFFSIPMSTLAFAFSHQLDVRMASAFSGAYLGFLAHHEHGNLSKGIAVHFWSVVMLGVESIFLMMHAQDASHTQPVSAQFSFMI